MTSWLHQMMTVGQMTKDELINYIQEQIQIYEDDLDMTTEEDLSLIHI